MSYGLIAQVVVIFVLLVGGIVIAGFSILYSGESFGKWSIKFTFTLGLGLSMVGACLILFFVFFDEHRGTLIFATSVIGGLGALYSAIYIGQTLRRNIQTERITKTFDIMWRFEKPEIVEVYRFVMDYLVTQKVLPDDIYTKISENVKLYTGARTILNQFEVISLAIQQKHFDETISYKMFGMMVPFFYDHLMPFINGLREFLQKDQNSDKIYVEFVKLALAWKAGKHLATQRPLPRL